MNMIDRIKGILLQPKQEWQTISGETATVADLYKNYILPLAAIGPAASVIGMSVVGVRIPFAGAYRMSIAQAVSYAVVRYILTLVSVYILALIIDALAATFSGEKNISQALKVSAYSATAAWVAGIFAVIPQLSVLGILGLYSLYLLYVGLPILMKSPQEKSMGYTVAVVVAAIVIFIVVGVVSRSVIPYSMTGPMPEMK